jgi:hypothetical protein
MKSLKYQILLAALLFGLSFDTQSQTIHAILVADSKDAKIGSGAKQDISHIILLLQNASRATGYELKLQIIEPNYSILFGSNFDVPEITSIILGLDIEKDDVFFFYYSGHGSKSFNEDDPFARPHIEGYEHKYLSLQMVQKLAQISEPKLSIVMGSLCNVFSVDEDLNRPNSNFVGWKDKRLSSKGSLIKLRELFAQEGHITSTSSKRGKLSFTRKNGSAFTRFFINCLYASLETESSPTWNDILSDTKALSEKSINVTPYYEIELRSN